MIWEYWLGGHDEREQWMGGTLGMEGSKVVVVGIFDPEVWRDTTPCSSFKEEVAYNFHFLSQNLLRVSIEEKQQTE